jgi:signal transduction histidine kinase
MAIIVDRQHYPPPGWPRKAWRHRRRPWSARAWGQALYLASGIPVLLLTWIVPFAVMRRAARWNWPTPQGGWIYVAVLLALLLLCGPALTRIHRRRLRVLAGVEIPPQPVGPLRQLARDRRLSPDQRAVALTTLFPAAITGAVRSRAMWRQACYHVVAAPALAVAAIIAVGTWLASVLYTFTYVYAWGLDPGSMLYRATYAPMPTRLPPVAGLFQPGIALTVAGVAGLFAAPWLTAAVVALDVRVTSALLGPSRTAELQHRVEQLTKTRAGVVDAADAERRRLERDLHDGTQQRLVSLAMNLGMARVQATTAEGAKQAIAEAHEEAKAALSELRDLIRGLHPAVLEDRGLDAALSGVAARMPIPVRLSVDLSRRPSPVIEAVAYFVVSEGLANITKHAQASQAEVVVTRAGDRLHVIVSDDGVGGANEARGTGLAGLARRAASVDGTFEIISPLGGPTLLTVDLPCAR